MRIVLQRVKEAQVTVDSKVVGKITKGLLIFMGAAKIDTPRDAEFLAQKAAELRIFEDANGKMNLAAGEVNAEFLVVSQFTLLGDCTKGRRPSFDAAADPRSGETLYNLFIEQLRAMNFKVETGQFRARMDVTLVNDGPVTFILDSKDKGGS